MQGRNARAMKSFLKVVFAVYLVLLLWLVLFKFSYDLVSVIATVHIRSLNFIPFAGNGRREMLENLLIFVPFGLLLSVTAKRMTMWWKLVIILAFSVAVEITQFVLAIGRTDITDVITNTLGGLLGLGLYALGKKHMDKGKLDMVIGVVVAALLAIVILLRTLVFRFKY